MWTRAAVLVALVVLALTGCQRKQSAFDAWGVPASGIPAYELTQATDEPGSLFSAQVADPGWSEEQAKQVAAEVIDQRRDTYGAVVVRFVSDAGTRIAAYARDEAGAGQLRSAGFDPAEVEESGFPFLGFIRTAPEGEAQPAPL